MIAPRIILAVFTFAAAPIVASAAPIPHIAVIIADDFGLDVLSCFDGGSTAPFTPNICDRLTSGGIKLTHAWANPTCTPTRSTIQTGRYGFRTGVFAPGDLLPLSEQTIAEVLDDPINASLGVRTAIIGKWHLGGGNFGCIPGVVLPEAHGWDVFRGACSNLVQTVGNGYFNWVRTTDDLSTPPVMQQCNGAPSGAPACIQQPYATTVQVDDAIQWVGQDANPWVLWMAFNAPHFPFDRPPDQCPTGPCHTKIAELDALGVPVGGRCSGSSIRVCFEAMVETLDVELGRLLDNLPPDTLVFFIGDNGTDSTVVLDPCLVGRAKFTVFEGGLRVPLIISGPAVAQPGTVSEVLVNMSDLHRTVLELAGAVLPAGAAQDSMSLASLIAGASPAGRTYVYSERQEATSIGYERATRNAIYKLVRRPNANPENRSLFDLRPVAGQCGETVDLIDETLPDPIGALTPEARANYDDLEEYLLFLDGQIAACPVARKCGPTCQSGQGCSISALGTTACVQPGGGLFQCPPGTNIRVRRCPCHSPLGPFCSRPEVSWFCG